jgi:dTDP-4-amino-4,6-dideoxygalactose transaminase
LLAGAVPVFVDIDPATFTMCADDLQRRVAAARRQGLNPTTVMTVDLYGMPADYAAIEAICAREGLTILADAAQSFGGEVNGRRVGALAPMTATSFYPTKTLGCYGDGGAIFITDADMVDVLASLRWHGTNAGKKVSERVGLNGRLDTFQAVVLNAKLDIFDEERARRRIIAELYDECFQDTVRRQKAPAGAVSAHGLYTVAVEERDTVRAHLAEHGIPSAVYYEHPLHTMPAFAAYAPDPLPGAEWAARRVLSLPMHPYLSEAQARFVAETLLQAVGR